MKIFLFAAGLILLTGAVGQAANATPALAALLQDVIARDHDNQEKLQSMSYHQLLQSDQLDGKGKVLKHQEVQMIIRPGSAEEVEVVSARGDDLPTDPDAAAQEARGEETKRKRMKFELKDLAQRFTISYAGTNVFRGQPVKIIAFEPKPGQPYADQTEKVLNQLHGTMWISTRDYSVLKTDATLAHPVDVAWFLAQVTTLDFHYELDNTSGGMGPAVVRTFVVVEAPFITFRQRMKIEMTQFQARLPAVAGR